MSFGGVSEKQGRCFPPLLLPSLLHLSHSTPCKTCNQLLKSWERRSAAALFAKLWGTKQKFISPDIVWEYPRIQEDQIFGGFHFRNGHTFILYSLCHHIRNFAMSKSYGVEVTEQCIVSARWQSLLDNQAVLPSSTSSNKIIRFVLLHINLLSIPGIL